MASTGYGPSGASAAAEKLLIFNGKPGTFADFKFRFEIHIKVLGHVTVIPMAIEDYRTHITGRTTRSGEAEARANKGMVESAAIAALLVPRLSKEVLDGLRSSLPPEHLSDGRDVGISYQHVCSVSVLEEPISKEWRWR